MVVDTLELPLNMQKKPHDLLPEKELYFNWGAYVFQNYLILSHPRLKLYFIWCEDYKYNILQMFDNF